MDIKARANPKALKLDGLESLNKKVTIGFKCHPHVKLHLASEAKRAGLTLSEFIETLIQQLETAVQLEKQEVELLKQRLAFYENEQLLKFFKEYEGQQIEFTSATSEKMKVDIKEPRDVYTILINSFKFKK